MSKIAKAYGNFFSLLLNFIKNKNTGNIFISPISIFFVLAFLLSGLSTISENELLTILSNNAPSINKIKNLEQQHSLSNELLEQTSKLLAKLTDYHQMNSKKTNKFPLKIANGLFVDQDFEILESFEDSSQKLFFTIPKICPFSKNAPKSRDVINKFVADETDQMIKDLLPKNSIDSTTKMVLINAILFLGKWKNAFDPKNTLTSQIFKKFDNSPKNEKDSLADFMIKRDLKLSEGDFADFYENSEFQALTLDYNASKNSKKSDYQITFLKPQKNTKEALNSLETEFLNKKSIKKMIKNENSQKIKTKELGLIKIPKLKNLEFEMDLKEILQKMGVVSIFDAENADFSNLAVESDGLYVSKVLHKAKIEIDEIGTKAAAATAVVVNFRSLAVPKKKFKPDFILDSPFIFVITHVPTNTVIFYGRIVKL